VNDVRPGHTLLRSPAALVLLASLSGCLTVASQLSYATRVAPDRMLDPNAVVYGGSRIHFRALGDGPFDGRMWRAEPAGQVLVSLFVLVDLPLCLVADTVLLPVTLLERAIAGAAAGLTGEPDGAPGRTRE